MSEKIQVKVKDCDHGDSRKLYRLTGDTDPNVVISESPGPLTHYQNSRFHRCVARFKKQFICSSFTAEVKQCKYVVVLAQKSRSSEMKIFSKVKGALLIRLSILCQKW